MKTIGIVGYRIGDSAFGCANTYLEFAQQFGKPRILMPQDDVENIDALLLPGGLDVNPNSYGEAPAFATSSTDVFKQYFFEKKLDLYIQKNIPIFGICLGLQQLNVRFGGKLCQHLKFHDQSPARWVTGHDVSLLNMHKVNWQGLPKMAVNSHHHQAVLESTLSEKLIPLARAKNNDTLTGDKADAIIEAFIHRNLRIAAVQWHPEELYDDFSMHLFNHILNNK